MDASKKVQKDELDLETRPVRLLVVAAHLPRGFRARRFAYYLPVALVKAVARGRILLFPPTPTAIGHLVYRRGERTACLCVGG